MVFIPLRPRLMLTLSAALLVATTSSAQPTFDATDADRVLSVARQQLTRTAAVVAPTQYPKSTRGDGTWTTVPNTNLTGWTQGFFPGSLWLMHQAGGEAVWRTRADQWTRNLELQKTNTQTHDLGFKFMPSFGHAYRLTGDPYYRDVLLTAARSLAVRYNPTVGIIDCCDWNSAWDVPLVVDTMANIELLLWGSQNGGEAAWRDMALNHALRTMADLVRPDGSTFHVVDYDGAGRIRSRGTFQGYDDRGVDPGAQWMAPSFNDAGWRSGPGQLGYGDGDEATLLTKTVPSQPSVYFRRHVTLSGPVTQAALRVLHDDGVAVWVNGQQVFARYVDRGTAHSVYASAASQDNELSSSTIPLSPNPFREGDNVIAVMVKQVGGGSSDLSFDFELTVTTAPTSGAGVTVVSPNGGETLRPGDVHTLRWTSTGLTADVRLELSTDNGATWQMITASAANTGQYAWTVPSVTTRQARIRVSDAANPTVSDVSDAVFSIVTETVIRPILFGSSWRYDDRGVDPGAQWRTLTFDDSSWKTGVGQLGYGDGDEATRMVQTSPAQPSVYFRKKISISGQVTRAELRVLHDDGIAVWVNGTLVFSKYVANGTGHAIYASAASLDNELSTSVIASAPFVPGENIIAVMVKQGGPGSSDISFDLALTLTVAGGAPPPEETVEAVPLGSVWRYDDTGTDRGTAWLALGYDDAAWRSGPAHLGYGDGDEATVLRSSPVVPSYYFRRRFRVEGQVTQAQLRAVFDDAVAVWVNGTLVFSRNMGNGTAFGAYASAVSADNEVANVTLDLTRSPFVPGDNVVTVMVKQAGPGSSDVSFDLSLTLTVRR